MLRRSHVQRHLTLLVALLLLAGCAATPRTPLFLSPDFQAMQVSTVTLLPVTFDQRYEPPYAIDFDRELRRQLEKELQKKGYRTVPGHGSDSYSATVPANAASAAGAEAALAVHVDFLIISDSYAERNPPPMIDIEAEARLLSQTKGGELWRDRRSARLGGAGGMPLLYPAADLSLALNILAERLLETLPGPTARQAR